MISKIIAPYFCAMLSMAQISCSVSRGRLGMDKIPNLKKLLPKELLPFKLKGSSQSKGSGVANDGAALGLPLSSSGAIALGYGPGDPTKKYEIQAVSLPCLVQPDQSKEGMCKWFFPKKEEKKTFDWTRLLSDIEPSPLKGLLTELLIKVESLENDNEKQKKTINNLLKITKQLKQKTSTLKLKEQLKKLNIDCCPSNDQTSAISPSYVKIDALSLPGQVNRSDGQPCSSLQNRAEEEWLLIPVGSSRAVYPSVVSQPLSSYQILSQQVKENSYAANPLLSSRQRYSFDKDDRDYENIANGSQALPSSEEKTQLDFTEVDEILNKLLLQFNNKSV